jgi:G:T-mismatch repair DNA endonuclease (very short patch repair protein)
MGVAERAEFLEWYEGQKSELFYNKRVLESYCQDDVTVLRGASQVFRREFLAIGYIEVFLESVTIASARNSVEIPVFEARFHRTNSHRGYAGNVKYSKKTLMWLVNRAQTDGCKILFGGNGREYRLPDVPNLSSDGFCVETGTVYEFLGCFWNGHKCLHFRDVTMSSVETLAERYKQTMQRLEKITRVGYQVIVQWKCDFERDILSKQPELHTHPEFDREPLNTRDALYGGRNEAMRLYYKGREGETIQYCDIMALYPYICKYFKFPVGHPVIHVGMWMPYYRRTV